MLFIKIISRESGNPSSNCHISVPGAVTARKDEMERGNILSYLEKFVNFPIKNHCSMLAFMLSLAHSQDRSSRLTSVSSTSFLRIKPKEKIMNISPTFSRNVFEKTFQT